MGTSLLYICTNKNKNFMAKRTGIYMILCIENNKKYIGKSVDIHKRWSRHRWELGRNEHNSQHLQNAWNIYGADRFVFSVIEDCSISELSIKEEQYIEHYRSIQPEYGYNVAYKALVEDKIQEGRNIIRNPEHYKNRIGKPIVSIDSTTGEVQHYTSYKEIQANAKLIQECLATWKGTDAIKKRWTVNNLILLYTDQYQAQIDYVDKLRQIKLSNIAQAGLKRRRRDKTVKEKQPKKGNPILVTNIASGEQKEYPNLKGMVRELNLTLSLVRKCLSPNFTNTQHKGYRFELIKNFENISQ